MNLEQETTTYIQGIRVILEYSVNKKMVSVTAAPQTWRELVSAQEKAKSPTKVELPEALLVLNMDIETQKPCLHLNPDCLQKYADEITDKPSFIKDATVKSEQFLKKCFQQDKE
jgi:hypothetical protein